VRFNILFTTAAAFQHRLLLIQRQLFKQPAELIGQFTAGDALRMFGAQLVGEIASQVAKARAPVALGFFTCLDGRLLLFFTAGDNALCP